MLAKLMPYATANVALQSISPGRTKESRMITYDMNSGLYAWYAASSIVACAVKIRVTLYSTPVLSYMCRDIMLEGWLGEWVKTWNATYGKNVEYHVFVYFRTN
jgi:hypothetical protein